VFWATSKVNQYENLPPELRSTNRFCCWRYEKVKGQIQKIPYNPVTGRKARPKNPNTFKNFHSALAVIDHYDGIGFLVGSGICGIDLDDCFDDAGELNSEAQNVVDAFSDCYMEYSPSGKGLHIYFKASGFNYDKNKYYVNNKKLGMEVYVSGATTRFLTVTGNVFRRGAISEKFGTLQEILNEHMVRPKPVRQAVDWETESYLTDESVLEKASASLNGEKFKALWNGDLTGYAFHSEADLALCSMLAFWCGRDVHQMNRLFRKSGLMRSNCEYQINNCQRILIIGQTE